MTRAGSIMAISILLSRILGMVRDTVMLSQFGIVNDTDAYRIAIQIPDMIFMLVAGGGLSSAFLPVFSDLWYKDKKEDAWKAFSVILTLCFLVSTGLVVLAWAYSPQIVDYFRDQKPASLSPAAVHMSRVMLPAQIAFLCGSVLLGTLYARKHFIGPGLAPNVYNLGIILGAMLLPGLFGLGIESMAWGALIGAVIGNIVLPVGLMARVGSKFKPSLDFNAPGVKTFFKLLLPVLFGFSLPSMVNIITQKFASSYGSEGINTILATANNLMQAPAGIFGQSLALAAFPVLAEFVATGRMDMYRDQVSRTIRTVLYLGLPAGALMFALAPQIVHILYGWGKANQSPDDLAGIVRCLQIYSVGIFAWCVQPVLMRGFFSLHKTFKPIAISTVMTVCFIALCVLATKNSTDYTLLPWATNVAAILLAVVLFVSLELEVGALDKGAIVAAFVRSSIAAMIAGGAAYGGSMIWKPATRLSEIGSLIVLGLVACWIYYFVTKLFGMREAEYVAAAMNKRRNRNKPDAGPPPESEMPPEEP